MAETKNLYQKLLAITEEIGKIEKTGRNTAQGYAFIEQAKVVAEVRVQLAKHGVMIIPETVSRNIEHWTVTKPGYNPADPPKEQATFHANVVSRYTLVNADNPGERMVCEWDAGEALDTSDKATNKATTASHKSYLMKLFNISDKDDPDADSHQVEVPDRKPMYAKKEPTLLSEETQTKLGTAVKLKGVTDKQEIINLLNALSKSSYNKNVFLSLTEDEAKEMLNTIHKTNPDALTMLVGNQMS